VPAQQRLGRDQEARPAGAGQHAADRGEQRPVGGLEPGPRDLAAQDGELLAQDQDLEILGGVTASEQHQQLDGPAQRHVREFGDHQGGLPVKVAAASPYRATDANTQLTGHIRRCAPFTATNGSGGSDRDVEYVAVLHRMASIGIKADVEDS
jgi:hypothetical protein